LLVLVLLDRRHAKAVALLSQLANPQLPHVCLFALIQAVERSRFCTPLCPHGSVPPSAQDTDYNGEILVHHGAPTKLLKELI
jgi:hypothetical protein